MTLDSIGASALDPPRDMATLRRISAVLGSDLSFVQGAGGNSSVKDGDLLWVKASGTWLADAEASDIFVPLDLATVRRNLAAGADDCAAGAMRNDDRRRASIEASIHAVLPHRIVLHVHCVDTIAWAVQRGGEREIAKRLDGLAWTWIRYRRPGAPLARELVASLRDGVTPDILILQNHGLVVGGDSCETAMERLRDVRARLAVAARVSPPSSAARRFPAPDGFRWSDDALIAGLAFDATAREAARVGVLYPDHVVFLGAAFSELRAGEEAAAALARWQAAFGALPRYLVVPDVGVLVAAAAVPADIAMLQCLALVAARLTPQNLAGAGLTCLSPADIAALMNWDAEAYRQGLATLDKAG